VEGFCEANIQSFHINRKYISKYAANYEIEKNVNCILDFLDDMNTKATFFFLGRVARDVPATVKQTAERGHEIACHSFQHIRLYDLTHKKFKESLIESKKYLEDISGTAVRGFRAPDFSIIQINIWALDIIKELGFDYDSSICPTGIHDVYGIEDEDSFIHKMKNGLIEFPVSVYTFRKKKIPFGGGGYFRLYPLSITKYMIKKINEKGHPCMFYMHPYEIGDIIPKVGEISSYRKFRHYYNCKNGIKRLKKLFYSFEFCSALDILKERGFLQ
jgi:polysaccharide deacetylase family protein (PEP-CTERM system associated)